jgi:hypothetical protein
VTTAVVAGRRVATRVPRSALTATRTPAGARRAARALLVQSGEPGDSYWDMWAAIVLTGVLETVVVAGSAATTDGSPLAVCSMATVRRWLSRLVDGDRNDVDLALRTGRGVEQPGWVRELAVGARDLLSRFDAGVVDRLGARNGQAVIVRAYVALDRAIRPPPGIAGGEWFAARWRASAEPSPEQANLVELVADERRNGVGRGAGRRGSRTVPVPANGRPDHPARDLPPRNSMNAVTSR